MEIPNIIFTVIFIAAMGFFFWNLSKIVANIRLGRSENRLDNLGKRLMTMTRVALGQSKMTRKPVAGLLHIVVYIGFCLFTFEVIEIILDGILGTHRVFNTIPGYKTIVAGFFEVLAFLVLASCAIFLVRRNIIKIKRFKGPEMKKWPTSDANYILIAEILLMSAILIANAADAKLMMMNAAHYDTVNLVSSDFWISQAISGLLPDSESSLIMIERSAWWFHIVGILVFLNYLPYSKHLHIMFAFPNTFFSNLDKKGKMTNMESVTTEVKLMMDPTADPFAAPDPNAPVAEPQRFGAKDVTDLSWKSLLDSYTCTECGRCTDACPANQTGKALSPRKIMMDTRDRLEEIAPMIKKEGKDYTDGKSLLGDYVLDEEIWACTSCNACVMECPVNINPLSIIMEMRRYSVMEESKMPTELTGMLTNVENNGAPWQFSPTDRLNWKDEE
jgi:heterodisulfide reductase subunit C